LAITVLWLLARIRFPDRPAPPSPIPAVLGQLTTRPKLDDLAAEVGELRRRLAPSLVALHGSLDGSRATARTRRIAGLRYRDGVAVAQLSSRSLFDAPAVVAVDRASGLAVIREPGPVHHNRTPPVLWTPRDPQGPRYLVATDVSPAGVSLRPVFIGSFEAIGSALWTDALWAVPFDSDLAPGSFLFTGDAELVGLVITYGGQRAVVPAATLLAEADRLLASPRRPAGTLGVEVQALTPALASATGASSGLVVSWVDTAGAAAGRLRVGDVIESVDGRPVTHRGDWDVRMARLSVGDTVAVRGRSRGAALGTALVAAAATPPADRTVGLALRARPGLGAEVVRVQPGSAGQRAGLAAGDVITVVGGILAPTPRQVTRSFAAMREGPPQIVGITRGDTHIVTALER
jgi:S1-C subfamily serine protease